MDVIREGFYRIALNYGFMDEPNIPSALRAIHHKHLDFNTDDISYFLGGEILFATKRPGLALWRERLFVWVSRNSGRATSYHLPPEKVTEVSV